MAARKLNRILAAAVLIISFIVYLDTMAPTVSFWDCGEFIATSHTLAVPHPPGSPLYLIIGRIFSILPFNSDIAFRVNLISPLASALAVMFLYLIVVQFIAHWRGPIESVEDRLIAFGSGLVGSLAFAFTDSHWFNAVEAEVYAMSTLFTAVVVWLILRWAEKSDEPGNERYILIISYVLGLASGIHLLNLLALPFMALIIYFKKRQFTWLSFFILMGVVLAAFLIIYLGIIKGLPKFATVVSGLLRTNDAKTVIGATLATGAVMLIVAVAFAHRILPRYAPELRVTFSALLLILIGYSSYELIFIRSSQNPGIDENDPQTVGRAVKYLEREQYGNVTFLPRRYIKDKIGSPTHKAQIVGYPEKRRNEFSASQNFDYMFHKFGEQMKFLWNYQIVKMYVRYFLWQFAGRGPAGEAWVSDVGAQYSKKEDGVNWIQFGLPLPFLLGILGMFYHFKRDETQAFSVLTLLFMTGLAIIFYLNQDNPQPRERDYSYVGSFLAFSIWLGIGAAAVLNRVLERFRERTFRMRAAFAAAVIMLLLIPGVMASSNYHTHDRSGNYVAWTYSYNILQTCEPNAILFTNGDNDTFPLWYLQEVEGIRRDVTIANLSLLNTTWYIRQLRDCRPEGKRFVNLTDAQIRGEQPVWVSNSPPTVTGEIVTKGEETREFTFQFDPAGLGEKRLRREIAEKALAETGTNREEAETFNYRVRDYNQNPYTGKPLRLSVVPWVKTEMSIPVAYDSTGPQREIVWTMKPTHGGAVRIQDLMIMHIINESAKIGYPVYFAVTVSPKNMIGLDDYLQMEGLAHKVTYDKSLPRINYERLEENMMTVIDDESWSRGYEPGYMYTNLNDPSVYYNPNIVKLLQNLRFTFIQLAEHEVVKTGKGRAEEKSAESDSDDHRESARKYLEKMEELMPDDVVPIANFVMYDKLGDTYKAVGDEAMSRKAWEGAVALLEKDLRHDRGNFVLYYHVAEKYLKLGELNNSLGAYNNAITLLKKYMERNPGDDQAQRLLDICLYRRSQVSQKIGSQSPES